MEKTFKTGEAIETYMALNDFVSKDMEMSAQAAWDIEDNLEELKKVSDKFDKHRDEMLAPLNEAGAFEQDGENIKVKPEFRDEFLEVDAKLGKFLNTDNKLEIKMISKADLPEKFSVKDLKAVKFMINADDAATKE